MSVTWIEDLDIKLLKKQQMSLVSAATFNVGPDKEYLLGLENFISRIISAFEDGAIAVLIERSRIDG